MTLAELNGTTKEQFVATIGWTFEQSPWVAERAWHKKPFASFDELSTRLIQEVQGGSPDEQLALLCAHPDPATDGTPSGCAAEFELYRKKFGFPFLFAVKGNDQTGMAEALRRRLKSTPDQEFQIALGHVFRIARFRLEDTIA